MEGDNLGSPVALSTEDISPVVKNSGRVCVTTNIARPTRGLGQIHIELEKAKAHAPVRISQSWSVISGGGSLGF